MESTLGCLLSTLLRGICVKTKKIPDLIQISSSSSFSVPGTYVLRAVADDTVLTATVDVTVVVEPAE